MPQMLGPLDEYPLHQLPQPIAWPGSSDRNFYDRSYFNAHDRTGNIFLITGIGYYPNLGVKDAFVLIRRADIQTAVHLSDAIDSDRLHQHVNGYRVEVVEPLRKLRIVLDETEGVAADLTWEGLFDVVQEQPHVLRSGNRVTLDAQRFAQLGTWSGRIVVDGERIAVDPATWLGSRDRSWGIRPVGEPEPAGRPADPPFEGMWWLYVPLAFDDFAVVLIIQEEPDGFRSLNEEGYFVLLAEVGRKVIEAVGATPWDTASTVAAMVEGDHPVVAGQVGDLVCPGPDGADETVRQHNRIAVRRPEHLGV